MYSLPEITILREISVIIWSSGPLRDLSHALSNFSVSPATYLLCINTI